MSTPLWALRHTEAAEKLARRVLFKHNASLFPADEMYPTENQDPQLFVPPEAPPGEVANDPALRGMMLKRHSRAADPFGTRSADRWARRHVLVDDSKGRLCYSRESCESSTAKEMRLSLPLQDVTSIKQFALNDGGHCFEVAGAGASLCLRVDDPQECGRWVEALENRVHYWRKKADHEGPCTAVPLFGREAQREGSCWQLSGLRAAW